VKMTNRFDLPEAFIRFEQKNQHTKGTADFSATELIDSPQVARLKTKHYQEIQEDVSDRIMSILGTATHAILEQGAPLGSIVEERLSMVVDGVEISGGIDLQTPLPDDILWDEGGVQRVLISDYKTCSAFVIQTYPEGKPEWSNQLNIYAALAEANGRIVDSLEVVAIIRDWSSSAYKRNANYPEHAVVRVPIPMWEPEYRDEYIRERVELHTSSEDVRCTATERWERPTKYAVHELGKSGVLRKRATRVFTSLLEADMFLSSKDDRGEVQVRFGENVRCKGYCSVSEFCSQWKEIQENEQDG
jgi:hypothetical protein